MPVGARSNYSLGGEPFVCFYHIFFTLMPVAHFRLWYFIEGTCVVGCVIISKYKYVADLQSEIHSQSERSQFEGVAPGDLALLKVDIEPEPHHCGDDIQDLRAPDDADTLDVSQRICDIWRRRPDSGPLHLHICVRRPSTAMSKLLDAALRLHRNLWGNDLQGLLKSFPWVIKAKVNRLGLRSLGYQEDVLVFRQEYTIAFESLHLGSPMSRSGKPGVVVVGQPGSGKSSFIYYLLLRQLSDKKSTAFQVSSGHFVLFRDRARVYSGRDKGVVPEGTLALTGLQCNAFLDAPWVRDTWIHSLQPLGLGSSWGWHHANVFIKALGNILGLDVSEFIRIYNKWGPSARNCVQFSQRHVLECAHESHVYAAACDFVEDFYAARRRLIDRYTLSDPLFSIRAKETDRSVPVARVILKAAVKTYAVNRVEFYDSLRLDKSFRSTADHIQKSYLFAELSNLPDSMPTFWAPCRGTASEAPVLEIPVCPKHRSITLTDLSSMRDMETPRLRTPFCLLIEPLTGAAVDAIVCNDDGIITFQVIVSYPHDTSLGGFEHIRSQLPALFTGGETRRWCHVFVATDRKDEEALRDDLKEVPPADLNVTIYTIRFERLKELIRERWNRRVHHTR
ncbi:hypothetical protein EDB89DRAFT_1964677 [Lactarius sanguifluus]|nr:hypothetical protein EDB89DRAFT_1964677 [Lactarius sanguifluus]